MVRNHPGDPFQRQVLVDRASSCSIRAGLVGTVHGSLSPGKDPATLLVLDFKFQALKVNRRIKSADITLRFHGESDNPIVAKIAPQGSYSLVGRSNTFHCDFFVMLTSFSEVVPRKQR